MSTPQYTVTIEGQISWTLLWNYDNSTNSGTIKDKVTVKTSESVDYTSFEKTFNSTVRDELKKGHVGAEIGVSYAGITAKVESGIDVSEEVTETLEATTESTFKSNFTKESQYERDGMHRS